MKNGPWQPSIRWISTGTQLCLLWSLILWRPLLPVHFVGFPGASAGKESTCNVGNLGSVPGLVRSPGEWKGYPLQYCGLKNSMDCMYSPWGHKESDTTEWLSLSLPVKKDTSGSLPSAVAPHWLRPLTWRQSCFHSLLANHRAPEVLWHTGC